MNCLLALSLVALSLQTALPVERQAGPSVTVLNGTVVGSTSNNVDSFKGIPFAQPPVGNRRLRPPISLASSFGTISATKDGNPCPPNQASSTPAAGPEDCLYLNVQRPAGTKAGTNLPVLAYIYGGSFGAGSTVNIDAAQIISEATNLVGEPFVFVVFNYRLAAWGFLAGAELSSEGSTNLGLRDQRLALQWIQENIRAFGGDPTKVTVWGESAGSFSVLDQMLINNGDNQYNGGRLFRAAILSSGTSLVALPVTHSRPQAVFNKLAQSAGCSTAVNKLQCLRGVTPAKFASAVAAAAEPFDRTLVPYPPRPDPASSFFPTSPEKAIIAGTFSRVPVIIGDQEDEGTVFVDTLSSYSAGTTRLVDLLTQQLPELTRADATAFVNTYPGTSPESLIAGSPFRTGTGNEIFTGYKRISAIIGDFVFTLSRRITLDSIASLVPVYSSLGSYLYGQSNRGTQHGVDTGVILVLSPNYPFASQKKIRYVSFWSYADPNYLGLNGNAKIAGDPNYGQWPRYSTASRLLANFTNTPVGATLLTDDFRQNSYLEMKRNISRFAI